MNFEHWAGSDLEIFRNILYDLKNVLNYSFCISYKNRHLSILSIQNFPIENSRILERERYNDLRNGAIK